MLFYIYIIPLSFNILFFQASDKVVDLREKIKNFLAAQGMIKGHSGAGPRPNDQEPSILSLLADYASPSTSPQTPILSISSDERHLGVARNDYLRGDTDARKTPLVHFPALFLIFL
jgi:hypothetical protein